MPRRSGVTSIFNVAFVDVLISAAGGMLLVDSVLAALSSSRSAEALQQRYATIAVSASAFDASGNELPEQPELRLDLIAVPDKYDADEVGMIPRTWPQYELPWKSPPRKVCEEVSVKAPAPFVYASLRGIKPERLLFRLTITEFPRGADHIKLQGHVADPRSAHRSLVTAWCETVDESDFPAWRIQQPGNAKGEEPLKVDRADMRAARVLVAVWMTPSS